MPARCPGGDVELSWGKGEWRNEVETGEHLVRIQGHEPGCRSQKSECKMETGGGLGLGGGTLEGVMWLSSLLLTQVLGDRAPRGPWKRQGHRHVHLKRSFQSQYSFCPHGMNDPTLGFHFSILSSFPMFKTKEHNEAGFCLHCTVRIFQLKYREGVSPSGLGKEQDRPLGDKSTVRLFGSQSFQNEVKNKFFSKMNNGFFPT